jgi:hypothetical protein
MEWSWVWRHRMASAAVGVSMIAGSVGTAHAASGSPDPWTVRSKRPVLTLPGPVGSNRPSVQRTLDGVSNGTLAAMQSSGSGPEQRSSPTKSSMGCGDRNDAHRNVRVNQDCDYRPQAEEEVAVSPTDSRNLFAAQNDFRGAQVNCGIDYSTNGGRDWGDYLSPTGELKNAPEAPTSDPNQHTLFGDPGTHAVYEAGTDPSVAFDSAGRAFLACLAFDNYDFAAAIYVAQSPAEAKGSFVFRPRRFAFPGDTLTAFLVVEDNSVRAFHDKEFIAADSFKASPNRDNLYVTWTTMLSDGSGAFQQEPIYGSMSTDHGLTWSTPEQISGRSPTLCFFGDFFDSSLDAHSCDFDQGSDPVVLPNGDLVVAFANENTPISDPSSTTDPNQQKLAVRCHPTGSSPAGTAHLNCASPTKIGDSTLADRPLCDFGRGPEQCIPGPWVRDASDWPRTAVDRRTGTVYAAWSDYRNGEYDVQLASSADGINWSPATKVNPDSGLDHYQPAIDVGADGRVGVSYYRSERVPNENTSPVDGFTPGRDPGVQEAGNDYVLSAGKQTSPFVFKVVSPVFPAPDGAQAGFLGDYSGLAVSGTTAHPIWADPRNNNPFFPSFFVHRDEDIFTQATQLPAGRAKPQAGRIGRKR